MKTGCPGSAASRRGSLVEDPPDPFEIVDPTPAPVRSALAEPLWQAADHLVEELPLLVDVVVDDVVDVSVAAFVHRVSYGLPQALLSQRGDDRLLRAARVAVHQNLRASEGDREGGALVVVGGAVDEAPIRACPTALASGPATS